MREPSYLKELGPNEDPKLIPLPIVDYQTRAGHEATRPDQFKGPRNSIQWAKSTALVVAQLEQIQLFVTTRTSRGGTHPIHQLWWLKPWAWVHLFSLNI
ncbi:hypothetical protein V6N11_039153 [Hibiscus sabdariffa]|uniref:Uncharacterized protein n=1 Tax=Hibiscus sabdariffa TaxID=183260 RepID=A0ABR2SMG5_9ROSI